MTVDGRVPDPAGEDWWEFVRWMVDVRRASITTLEDVWTKPGKYTEEYELFLDGKEAE